MVIGWLIALLIRNTSYVDVLWAYGVGVLGLCYLVIQSDLCHPARLSILEGILAVWSIRLGTHLLRRCWGKPEDPRYAYLRKSLGKKANLGFFFFFQVHVHPRVPPPPYHSHFPNHRCPGNGPPPCLVFLATNLPMPPTWHFTDPATTIMDRRDYSSRGTHGLRCQTGAFNNTIAIHN